MARTKAVKSVGRVKKGQRVGWKYRNALILGDVIDIDGDKLTMQPLRPGTNHVTRHLNKVFTNIDEHDRHIAEERGGHMARRETTSHIPELNAKFHNAESNGSSQEDAGNGGGSNQPAAGAGKKRGRAPSRAGNSARPKARRRRSTSTSAQRA